jgi:hypothetical protein
MTHDDGGTGRTTAADDGGDIYSGGGGDASATPDEMIFDREAPGVNWQTMRRYKMLRAAQLGYRRIVETAEDALQTLTGVGYFNIRDAGCRAMAARTVLEHLIQLGAVDLISPGLAAESLADERDRMSRAVSSAKRRPGRKK